MVINLSAAWENVVHATEYAVRQKAMCVTMDRVGWHVNKVT